MTNIQIHDKTADQIGWDFLRWFSEMASTNPEALKSYYTQESSVTFYDETSKNFNDQPPNAIFGPQALDQRKSIFNYPDMLMAVYFASFQFSIGGSVLCSIKGEIQNENSHLRVFEQTLVLVPKNANYYVHNDIFRLVNETPRNFLVSSEQEEKKLVEENKPEVQKPVQEKKKEAEIKTEQKEEPSKKSSWAGVVGKVQQTVHDVQQKVHDVTSSLKNFSIMHPLGSKPEEKEDQKKKAFERKPRFDDKKDSQKIDRQNSLVLKNLPNGTTTEEAKKAMSKLKGLVDVKIMQTGNIGYADFASREDAVSAISAVITIKDKTITTEVRQPRNFDNAKARKPNAKPEFSKRDADGFTHKSKKALNPEL